MEQLNQYLQTLLNTAGYELHLEPNKKPYVVDAKGPTDVANTPLLGTQISMMVFPLIPPDVKQDLPNLPTIQFVHPHNLGKFSFTIEKSPAGFNVTVKPLLGSAIESNTSAPPVEAKPPAASSENHLEGNDLFQIESSSAGRQANVSTPVNVPTVSELLVEDPAAKPKVEIGGGPEIEVISANDPQFQTVFSDTSTYEPPGRRQDFEGVQLDSFDSQFGNISVETVDEPQTQTLQMPAHTTVPADAKLPSMDRRSTDRRKQNLMM